MKLSTSSDPMDKIAGRLATFIRLLSSDRDGEVLATVSAMIRTLRSAGVDVHALAQRVEQKVELSEAQMQKIFDAGVETGRTAGYQQAMAEIESQKQELKFHNVATSTYHAMAVYCQRNYSGGNSKERTFVNHMVEWTRRRDPSDKQAQWLEDIYERLGGS